MEEHQVSDNKRIARNAVYLYIRMIVMMGITLFTSREVLRILGVDDYGLYNVVAGIVILFAFFNSSMVRASQRYLSFYIGRCDDVQVNKIFCMCINVNISIALLLVVLAETVGLWFLNTQMNIPMGRMTTANVVYQLSIITFVINIFVIPYNSAIIAYERMSFYAYISIIEAILKWIIVYLLLLVKTDKLVIYAFLMAGVSLITLVLYIGFCRFKFTICKYTWIWDKKAFLDLFSFSGWSMVSGAANLFAQQGGNIIMNIFCGLTANASFGIASQVGHAVLRLTTSFSTAFAPQITKLYAVDDKRKLYTLIFRSSLISYYLMMLFAVPLAFKMDFVLNMWLETVPDYAAGFCILIIIFELIDAIQSPLIHLVYSTGKIRTYVIWLGGLTLLNLPISIILLSLGMSVYYVLGLRAFINLLTAVIRVVYLKQMINFPYKEYINDVVLRALAVTIIIISVFLFIIQLSILGNVLFLVISCIISGMVIIKYGFSSKDKAILKLAIYNKLNCYIPISRIIAQKNSQDIH